MVVCAERGENSSSHHPHISAAFLRGSRVWVVGLDKLFATALSAVTHGPPALSGVLLGAVIRGEACSAFQLKPSL